MVIFRYYNGKILQAGSQTTRFLHIGFHCSEKKTDLKCLVLTQLQLSEYWKKKQDQIQTFPCLMSEYTKDQLLKREYSFFICVSNNPRELQPLANFFQNPKAMQQIVK